MDPQNPTPQYQPPVTPPQYQPVSGMPAPAPKRPLGPIIAIALVVLVLAGAGVYFLLKPGTNPNADDAAQQSTKTAGNAKALSTFAQVTFAPPSDMSAYNAPTTAGNRQNYALKSSDKTQYCSLSFGTFSPTQLPGTDIESSLKPQLDSLKSSGMTIEGPTASTALILKDSKGTQYSLPTLNYRITNSSLQEVDHYSMAILSSGDRVTVTRTCAKKGGTVDESAFSVLDATAKKLVVSPK